MSLAIEDESPLREDFAMSLGLQAVARGSRRLVAAGLLCSATLLVHSPAWSQDPNPDPTESADPNDPPTHSAPAALEPPESSPSEASVGEEIIVTATKREANLQDLPGAITALGSEDIALRGVQSTEDLVGQVPNLQLSEQTGAVLLTIRGVGLGVETAAAEPGVAIHLDGAYQPRATTTFLQTLDLQRIEVLRGPQGTIYGRNATGGVINFISKRPTRHFEAEATLTAGNYDLFGAQAMVSGPIAGDRLLGRLVAFTESRDGYVKNIILDRRDGDLDSLGGRLSIRWNVSDSTVVDLIGRYARSETAPVTVMITPPLPEDIGFLLATSPPGTEFISTTEPFEIAEERIGRGKLTDLGLGLVVSSAIGDLDFTSITAFNRNTIRFVAGADGFNIPFITLDPRADKSTSFSQEFNLSRNGERLDWTIGAFAFSEKYFVDFRFPFPNFGIIQEFIADPEKTKSYAIFADFSYSLTPRLRLIGGARLGHDKKSIVNRVVTTIAPGDPSSVVIVVPFEGKSSDTTLAPKLGLQYDFTRDVMGYAVFQKGYKGGGFNFAAVGGDPFLPETITSYEAGIKSSLFGGRAIANLTGFYYDYKNLQLFKNLSIVALVENAPKSRVYGIELETSARITNNTTIQLSGSYLDAKFVKYSEDDIVLPGDNPENLAGHRLNRSPKYSFIGSLEQSVPLNSGLVEELRLRGEVSYTDDISFRPFNRPADVQKGYALVNAYMVLRGKNDRFSLRLFGRNLTNKAYYNQIQGGGIVFGGYRKGEWGSPRTYGISLTVRY